MFRSGGLRKGKATAARNPSRVRRPIEHPPAHLRSRPSAAKRRSSWAGVQGAKEAAANSADSTWSLGCTPASTISSKVCGAGRGGGGEERAA